MRFFNSPNTPPDAAINVIEFRNILINVRKGRCFMAEFRMEMSSADLKDALLPIFKAQAKVSGHDLTDDQIEIVVLVEHENVVLEFDLEDVAVSVAVDVPGSTPS